MKKLFTALLLSTSIFAGGLENNHVVTNQVYEIDVFDVTSAKIVKEKTETKEAPEGKYSNSTAILELDVHIQGNICGAEPKTVGAGIYNDVPIEDPKVRTYGLRFSYSFQKADPYELIQSACLAFSSASNIKVPVVLYGSAFWNMKTDIRRIMIYTGDLYGPRDPKLYKTIETTFDNSGHWTVKIK